MHLNSHFSSTEVLKRIVYSCLHEKAPPRRSPRGDENANIWAFNEYPVFSSHSKTIWQTQWIISLFYIKKNKTFPCLIKSWSAASGRLRHCLKLQEKMKNRSCIINDALYESVQVHLTQTPVWNAFWVTCCRALMSVILNSSKDRTLVDLAGRFMGC